MRGNAPKTSEHQFGGGFLTEAESRSSLQSVGSGLVPPRLVDRIPQIEIAPLDEWAIVTVGPNQKFKVESRVLGLSGTLLLHGLILNFVGWGFLAHKAPPPEPNGIGASRTESLMPPADELILLNLDSNQKGESDLQRSIESLTPHVAEIRIEVAPPQPVAVTAALEAGDAATANSDAGDPALRALMFGRYTGQISARIERAWVRPRTPVTSATKMAARGPSAEEDAASKDFKCRVQIRQDSDGNVQEVLILECNGTEAWRHSLIVAINQASPLPAPPTSSVFSRAMTLSFEAEPYHEGRSDDAYEREAAAATPERVAWRPTGAPARVPEPGALIHPKVSP
jgi:hypothetical protein